ncbi:helix-turn-helix domain-containing protein [Enterococcus faecalis]|uniref:helix-turn-helix domain-containing protein n=1 Tax=Enterococcus faecalis TaxID=1351 RepID=UPI000FC99C7D|nr:AraC family transcriptional regulator [Enterococcus faecalis]
MYFQVDNNKKEETKHVTNRLPIAIYHRFLIKERHDEITLHWHEELQFISVFSGTLLYNVEGKEFQLRQSESILINSSKIHGAIPKTELVEYICIDFSPFFINEEIYRLNIEKYSNEPSFSYAFLNLNTRHLAILNTIRKNLKEINFLAVYELLISSLNDLDKYQHPLQKTEEALMYQLLDYVHQHFHQPITVEEISQVIPISKKKCTNLFNSYTHLSPINYLIDYRLNQAKKMLLATELNVTEICFSIGFNNVSYFITQFKNKYSFTPFQFRKKFSQ